METFLQTLIWQTCIKAHLCVRVGHNVNALWLQSGRDVSAVVGFINNGKCVSGGSMFPKNLDKEAMHFSQNKDLKTRHRKGGRWASSCCSCPVLTFRNSKATWTIQSVYLQNSTLDSPGSICTDLQKLSLLPQKKNTHKKTPKAGQSKRNHSKYIPLLSSPCLVQKNLCNAQNS